MWPCKTHTARERERDRERQRVIDRYDRARDSLQPKTQHKEQNISLNSNRPGSGKDP